MKKPIPIESKRKKNDMEREQRGRSILIGLALLGEVGYALLFAYLGQRREPEELRRASYIFWARSSASCFIISICMVSEFLSDMRRYVPCFRISRPRSGVVSRLFCLR